MSSAIMKVNMISKIVLLMHVVARWKSKSLRGRRSTLFSSSESDEPADSHRRPAASFFAVYIGEERRRFVVPTRFINLPVFIALLDQAEEEFGYPATGGLTLPCDASFFSNILRLLDKDEEKFHQLGLVDFLHLASEAGFKPYDRSSCRESSPAAAAFLAASPLLQKTRV